jgi:hypothetical protein
MKDFTLIQLMSWIVYSGGSILIMSWVADRIQAFANATRDAKQNIIIAGSVILALGFYAILSYVPATVLVQLEPWFRIVFGIVITYSGGQVVHILTKSNPGVIMAAKKTRLP